MPQASKASLSRNLLLPLSQREDSNQILAELQKQLLLIDHDSSLHPVDVGTSPVEMHFSSPLLLNEVEGHPKSKIYGPRPTR